MKLWIKIMRGLVTLLLFLYFASRVLISSIRWSKGEIGTIQEKSADELVTYPTVALCKYSSDSVSSRVCTDYLKYIDKVIA